MVDDCGRVIANCGMEPSFQIDDDEALANANFIVKACNNYESLLEALRMAARWADPYDFPAEVLKAMSQAIQQATQP